MMSDLDEIYTEINYVSELHTELHGYFLDQRYYRIVSKHLKLELERVIIGKLTVAHEIYFQDLVDISTKEVKNYELTTGRAKRSVIRPSPGYQSIVRNFAKAVRNHAVLLREIVKNHEYDV